jgi:hypothetical protein
LPVRESQATTLLAIGGWSSCAAADHHDSQANRKQTTHFM